MRVSLVAPTRGAEREKCREERAWGIVVYGEGEDGGRGAEEKRGEEKGEGKGGRGGGVSS